MNKIHSTVFKSIIEVCDWIREETPKTPFGRDDYEWINWGDEDGRGRIMPSLNSPIISPFIFRGQSKRYSPCFPKVYREFPMIDHPSKLSEKCRDYYILCQVYLAEFSFILEQHPAMKFAKEIGLHVSPVALAQHYGIPTDHIDFTQDPEVAAFFATCAPDGKGGWIPKQEQNGLGVLYRFDLTVFPRMLGDDILPKFLKTVEMIGLQTLPRPGEQKAWTIRLPLGFDFERLPLDPFVFNHTKKGSELYFKKFEGGRLLFPPDMISDMASSILSEKSLSSVIVRKVLLEQGCRTELLNEALHTYNKRFHRYFGIIISDREPMQFSPDQILMLEKELEIKRSNFLKNVGVRPVIITHVPTLVKLLRDSSHWTRMNAARVLASLGKKAVSALPALEDALDDKNADVRKTVATAIKHISKYCQEKKA